MEQYVLAGTIITAGLSFIGVLLQYILPQRQAKPQEKLTESQERLTNAQRDNIVSETYERLLIEVRTRLDELQKDIIRYRDENIVLQERNDELELIVEK